MSQSNDTSPTPTQDTLPEYTATTSPPTYSEVNAILSSLATGPPDETVLVPMVMRRDSTSLHRFNPFSRRGYESTPSYISSRAMKRSMYLAHYAKDASGAYIGTGVAAPDAGLVFVASQSTSEDLLRQCEGVAKEMQKRRELGIGNFGKPFDAEAGRVDMNIGNGAMGGGMM